VDGHTLAERARAVHAELKVLLTTGYIRGGSAERARIGPDVELIVKLFTPRRSPKRSAGCSSSWRRVAFGG
jgi:hypothetical protein